MLNDIPLHIIAPLLPGDFHHPEEINHPRTQTTYITGGGAPILISRTWFIHARDNAQSTLTATTIRAHSQSAEWNDPANAISTQTSHQPDNLSVNPHLRGLPLSETDESGLTTAYSYRIDDYTTASEIILFTTTRQYTQAAPNGIPEKSTLRVEGQDLISGTMRHAETLLQSNYECLDWEDHFYDSQNRLVESHFADGTFNVNSYSCCRLLWNQDRSGKFTERVATTGLDHLHYALHETSLCGESGDYPVAEYWFDALGRQTNRVDTTSANQIRRENKTFYRNYVNRTETEQIDMRGNRRLTTRTGYPDREETLVLEYPAGAAEHTHRTHTIAYRNGLHGTWETFAGVPEVVNISEIHYRPDGKRIETRFQRDDENLNYLTRTTTLYDLLGRIIEIQTPTQAITNTYHGSSWRLHQTTTASGNVSATLTYLYDALGNQIGSEQNGISTRREESYEPSSEAYWHVIGAYWHIIDTVTSGDGIFRVTSEHEKTMGQLYHPLHQHLEKEIYSGTGPGKCLWLTEYKDDIYTYRRYQYLTGWENHILTAGRLSEITTADNHTSFSYDGFGQQKTLSCFSDESCSQLLYQTIHAYNDYGDLIRETTAYPSGLTTENHYTHDTYGRLLTSTDTLGHTITNTYDAAGRLIEQSGATYPARHSYDPLGRRTTLQTTRGIDFPDYTPVWDTTQWVYGPATSLPIAKIYPDFTQTTLTYTPADQIQSLTTPGGIIKENTYDTLGRLVAQTYTTPDPILATATVTYTYTPAGQLHTASFGSGNSITHTYNEIGQPTGETWNIRNETGGNHETQIRHEVYEYGVRGRLVVVSPQTETLAQNPGAPSVVNRSTSTTEHYYGSVNLLYETILYNRSGRIISIGYDYEKKYATPLQTQTLIRTPTGAVFTKTLARAERPHLITNITYTIGNQIISTRNYTYDLLGRLTARTSPAGTDTFTYNPRSEVTTAHLAAAQDPNTYLYDPIGNRTDTTAQGDPTPSPFNPLNQPLSLIHDLNGNLASTPSASYAYDAENRLVTATLPSGELFAYTYDHQSRRIRKTTPAATRDYIYDGWNLALETVASADGTIHCIEYFWGNDLSGSLHGAGGIGGLLAVSINGLFYFPLYDPNGNIIAYADETGALVAAYTYDAFGQTIAQTGPMAEKFRFRFSTKYHDPETDLYYYGYRYYSPDLGRWLTRDPIEENGGLNLYTFLQNNGINKIDVLGMNGKNGSDCNYCGSEIAKGLELTLKDLGTRFNALSKDAKERACSYSRLRLTWDINFPPSPRGCGGVPSKKPCGETYMVNGQCHNKWEINYALFGRISKLCDFYEAETDLLVFGQKIIMKPVLQVMAGEDIEWQYTSQVRDWTTIGRNFSGTLPASLPSVKEKYKKCKPCTKQGENHDMFSNAFKTTWP